MGSHGSSVKKDGADEPFENEQRVKSDAEDLDIPIEREGFLAP